jgi:hypothetical protein
MPVAIGYIYYNAQDAVAITRAKPVGAPTRAPTQFVNVPSVDQQPATILGGALKSVASSGSASASTMPGQNVNLLV